MVAADVERLLHSVAGRTGARAFDLGQPGHIGVAQNQADIGMGDETAAGVDDKGAAVDADLDLRHHVPDQLEIDLRDADAGITPRAGERDRHIGLGLAAEIDRSVIDLVGHRLLEFRLVGIIDAAADHVHGEPRHFQLLVAGGVDLRQFGDRRHLAQQAKRIEAPLIERAVGPRQLRGPAHLTVDLGDEFLDLVGGGLRLQALGLDQRRLVLTIGEPDLEGAVADQRQHHNRNQQRDVFDEQPAADDRGRGRRSRRAGAIGTRSQRLLCPIRLFAINVGLHRPILAFLPTIGPAHSMTSSANATNSGGRLMPVALALFRLTTSG